MPGETDGGNLPRRWPNIQADCQYELGKYNISFEEGNEAAVLRYVDCGLR